MKTRECPQDKRMLYWQEIIIHIKSIEGNWQRKRKKKKKCNASWIKRTKNPRMASGRFRISSGILQGMFLKA